MSTPPLPPASTLRRPPRFPTAAAATLALRVLARAAPLDLTVALNLDGGPVASQGIALDGFRRSVCGQWELAVHGDVRELLMPLLWSRARCWEMPIVLAVLPK